MKFRNAFFLLLAAGAALFRLPGVAASGNAAAVLAHPAGFNPAGWRDCCHGTRWRGRQ